MRHVLAILATVGLLGSLVVIAFFAWLGIAGEQTPSIEYIALAGGALCAVLVGIGSMILKFYTSRHAGEFLAHLPSR